MKKSVNQLIITLAHMLIIVLSYLLNITSASAQSPQKLSYQAIVRTTAGELVKNSNVGMRIAILQGSASGTAVYTETKTPATNANGLINIEIGGGAGFSSIDWAAGPYFLKTETDPKGGTNYIITGTSQLLSVPYAVHAKTAEAKTVPETDPVFTSWDNNYEDIKDKPAAISDFTMSAGSRNITGLADPVNAQDAATKAYVDALLARIEAIENSKPGILQNGFSDARDGTHYRAVKIGNQIWMAENLAYLPRANQGANGSEDAAGSYYYVYGYNGTNVADAKATSNYDAYGVLYNWTSAMAGSSGSSTNPSGVQGVCPAGWHLPSDAEWTELTDTLGGISVAGGKLKETGTIHWSNPNNGATNETGFTALPGGNRIDNGNFGDIGIYGYWWSATESNTGNALLRDLENYASKVNSYSYDKNFGFSVRCVKD